jgi:hypothetical protein
MRKRKYRPGDKVRVPFGGRSADALVISHQRDWGIGPFVDVTIYLEGFDGDPDSTLPMFYEADCITLVEPDTYRTAARERRTGKAS